MLEPSAVTIACGAYIALLLLMGAAGRRAMPHPTLTEHFLAGRSIGFTVLLLTLFATQYSGNSLSAFPGKTYRDGLSYVMAVTFMVGIVAGYLLFAPSLVRRARRRRYLTPTDFLHDRFRSPLLDYLSAAIFAATLVNFLLAQLMAMGHAFAGLTDDRIPYWAGVVGGAVVVLIYETLGGLRAVAWTDALQGFLLLAGLAVVVGLILATIGSPAAILAAVPADKVANPGWRVCLTWASSFVLLGLGAPLYPQAIQRLYAARRLVELRRALAVMALLPLAAITTVIFIGATGLALFPDLDRAASDQVTFRVLARLVELEPSASLPALLVMMAVLAAIMSTADSALLSLASIFTKDFAARFAGLDDRQAERMTRAIPIFSVLTLAILVPIALQPRVTLWRLLEVKFELLIQLSPAFVLGTLHTRGDPQAFTRRDIASGLAVGLAVGLALHLGGVSSLGGLHPGTLGVAGNYAVVMASRAWRLRRRPPLPG